MMAIFWLITPVKVVNIFPARNQLGRARGRKRRVERIIMIVEGRRIESENHIKPAATLFT